MQNLNYLLAVDRLQFYIQNLADYIEEKKPPQIAENLRSISPEDIYNLGLPLSQLELSQEWQQIIFKVLKSKNSTIDLNSEDLNWNYNFFKKKLLQRFVVKSLKEPSPTTPAIFIPPKESSPVYRSIPKISGQKSLLDFERYISEKTSRAIIWDAILNDRDFEFHIGTLQEFQNTIRQNNTKIIGEVLPLARNYNKIFLAYNPHSNRFSYIVNLISGDDRIKHLMSELRLIRFFGKGYLNPDHDKVRIYGNATRLHKQQESSLLELFTRLPKADKVIIGQKSAIDDAIRTAGMISAISSNASDVSRSLGLTGKSKSKFENLMLKSTEVSAFLLDSKYSTGTKMEDAYQAFNAPIDRTFQQFTSQQQSHEFSDYLLEDQAGNIKRWRVISAVWGDEIIPIAEALKKSGHNNVVYIGTAGAIEGKGIQVGDVIPGSIVVTHNGKHLDFKEAALVSKTEQKNYTVGQVHTPFEETDSWLKEKGNLMDIVEVETGYLREHLGPDVQLESYFLISDIVGSINETLAHAGQNSSRRKKGQVRLLENLFVQNDIKAPISNFEMIPINSQFKKIYKRLSDLRPSRDTYSLLQIAHLAMRDGLVTDEQLLTLLKSQPAFNRHDFNIGLQSLGNLLVEIQNKIGLKNRMGLISQELFNGTYNPKVKTKIKIFCENTSHEDLLKSLGKNRLDFYKRQLSKFYDLELVDSRYDHTLFSKSFHYDSSNKIFTLIQSEVYTRVGFMNELDSSGKFRTKEIPGLLGGVRCETVF